MKLSPRDFFKLCDLANFKVLELYNSGDHNDEWLSTCINYIGFDGKVQTEKWPWNEIKDVDEETAKRLIQLGVIYHLLDIETPELERLHKMLWEL